MGWLFKPGSSRSDLIRELTTGWSNDTVTAVCLTHTLRGNVLWTVWEHRFHNDQPTSRFIGCDLLLYHPKNACWGYKSMDESMGPCYYTCPLSFLAMTPTLNPEWRAVVRAHHARIRRPDLHLRVGLTVALKCNYPPSAQIVSLKPLRGRYNGTVYRLARRMIDRVLDTHATSTTTRVA